MKDKHYPLGIAFLVIFQVYCEEDQQKQLQEITQLSSNNMQKILTKKNPSTLPFDKAQCRHPNAINDVEASSFVKTTENGLAKTHEKIMTPDCSKLSLTKKNKEKFEKAPEFTNEITTEKLKKKLLEDPPTLPFDKAQCRHSDTINDVEASSFVKTMEDRLAKTHQKTIGQDYAKNLSLSKKSENKTKKSITLTNNVTIDMATYRGKFAPFDIPPSTLKIMIGDKEIAPGETIEIDPQTKKINIIYEWEKKQGWITYHNEKKEIVFALDGKEINPALSFSFDTEYRLSLKGGTIIESECKDLKNKKS